MILVSSIDLECNVVGILRVRIKGCKTTALACWVGKNQDTLRILARASALEACHTIGFVWNYHC